MMNRNSPSSNIRSVWSNFSMLPTPRYSTSFSESTLMVFISTHKNSGTENGRARFVLQLATLYAIDLDSVVAGLADALRPGKSMTFVIANNTADGVILPVVEVMKDIFGRNGLTKVQVTERALAVVHRRYPNGRDGFKGLMQTEYLIDGAKLEPRPIVAAQPAGAN